MSLFNFDLRNFRLVLAGGALMLGGGMLGGGCSGADYSTLTAFCQALAQADCSQAVVGACYGSSSQTIQGDTESCIAARSRVEVCNPDGLIYDPEFAGKCVAQHEAVYENAQINGMGYASLLSACLPVLNRNGQQGASCSTDVDCNVGNQLHCVVHTGGGTCQVPTMTGGGESCSDPTAQCADGFYCDSGSHCVSAGSGGDKCGDGATCGDGLRCGGSATNPTCQNQLSNGEPCTVDDDCQGGICVGADGTANKGLCAATLTYALGGTACASFK